MRLNADFSDLFAELNAAGARYLLIGGYAVAFHGHPRFTKDLDVWVEPSPENASRVMSALEAFRCPLHDLTESDLSRPGLIFQIGAAPNRIDILTQADGIDFASAWEGRVSASYGDTPLNVIGKADLITNKRTTGRHQDIQDADALESIGDRP